ncbi:MAG: hypothetical protein JXR81_04345 [Candidatus Goldbacteria bacterium]|nr:hypothetical protein [Candidatus Goldiibacteriota bacterium]
MRKTLICAGLCLFISGCDFNGIKSFKGYKNYGGKTYDSVRSICNNPKGGYFLAGMTNSFPGGTIDGYLVKIDEKGREKFSRNFGEKGDDRLFKVITTKDGLLMCGYSDSKGAGLRDAYLVKTGFDGKEIFQSYFGGPGNDEAAGMCESLNGNIAMAGNSSSFSGSNAIEIYFVLADKNGNKLLTRTYGGGKFDFGTAIISADDGFVMAGRSSSWSKGGYDGFVMKLDAKGNSLAFKTFGDKGYDGFEDIIKTSDGGYAVVGETSDTAKDGNSAQVYLLKLDGRLNAVWEKTYGGKLIDTGKTIIEDGKNYVITGTTDSYGNGSSDIFVMKVDASGNSLWTSTFGGRKDEYAAGTVKAPDGGYVTAGWTGTYGKGEYDAFAAKIDNKGILK